MFSTTTSNRRYLFRAKNKNADFSTAFFDDKKNEEEPDNEDDVSKKIRRTTRVVVSFKQLLSMTAVLILLVLLGLPRLFPIFSSQQIIVSTASYKGDKRGVRPAPGGEERGLIDCSGMKDINILQKLAEGKQKIVYKVLLPSGETALAKRCKTKECVLRKLLENEGTYLRNLQRQYGASESIQFYGDCKAPYPPSLLANWSAYETYKKNLRQLIPLSIQSNFTQGYTILVELGKPLIQDSENPITETYRYSRCISKQFTPADLEDFRKVARQLAGYEEVSADSKVDGKISSTRTYVPVRLGRPGHYTDNVRAHNYIFSKAGIRLADVDMLEKCPTCTYDEALEYNCKVLRTVLRLKKHQHEGWDCSLEYSKKNEVTNPNEHINLTKATEVCTKEWFLNQPLGQKQNRTKQDDFEEAQSNQQHQLTRSK